MNAADVPTFLSYGFIQKAVVAGSFIAVLCSTLGVFLVFRRLAMIGDGLAHAAFGSVALALLLRVAPVALAIPLVVLNALGIVKLAERPRGLGDAAIGIVSAFGIAFGVLVSSVAGGFNVDLFSYLFGSILSISFGEAVAAVVLSVLVLGSVALFYHDLLSATFDQEFARVSGVRVCLLNRLLAALTAITVVLAMKVVGIMLVSSMLIMPPMTALQVSRGFRMTILLAAGVSVFAVLAGIAVSFGFDLPAGATIVMMNFFLLVAAFAYRWLAGSKH